MRVTCNKCSREGCYGPSHLINQRRRDGVYPIVLDYSHEFLPNENWDGSQKSRALYAPANRVRNGPWPFIPTALSQKLLPHAR